jgi:hypothetical protein
VQKALPPENDRTFSEKVKISEKVLYGSTFEEYRQRERVKE